MFVMTWVPWCSACSHTKFCLLVSLYCIKGFTYSQLYLVFDVSNMEDDCRDETGNVSLGEVLLMHVAQVAPRVATIGLSLAIPMISFSLSLSIGHGRATNIILTQLKIQPSQELVLTSLDLL